MNELEQFIEFMELELKNAKQNFEFATNDERKILFTVSIRLTEGYIQRAKAILQQNVDNK